MNINEKVRDIAIELLVTELPLICKKLELPEDLMARVWVKRGTTDGVFGRVSVQAKYSIVGTLKGVDTDSLYVSIYSDVIADSLSKTFPLWFLKFPVLGSKIIKFELKRTLAHEMRHVWQWHTGWMMLHAVHDDTMPYRFQAREIDARRWTKQYLKGGE